MAVKRTPGPGAAVLQKALSGLKDTKGKVGWFPSAQYQGYQPKTPDGKTGAPMPVAAIAIQNEYGNPALGIPARPFMRPTIAEKMQEWKQKFKSGAKAILAGNISSREVMEAVLLLVAGNIRRSITKVQSPPLKQATIDARLRKKADGKTIGNLTKPLVEEKIMINTISHEIE